MGRRRKSTRTSITQIWMQKLNDNRKKGIGVDCTIVVVNQKDNSTIRKDVHSQVMCAASDFCQRFLNENCEVVQKNHEITLLHLASKGGIEGFLDFTYVERFDPTSEAACEVISLSQIFELPSEVVDDLLARVQREMKTEKMCEQLIKLINQTRANPFRLSLVSKTMVSWVNIHAASLFPRRMRTNRKKGRDWVTLWESAADLLKESEAFKSKWTIVDVFKWVKLDHKDIGFAYLLNNILPNQLVQDDLQAKSVVVRSICSAAEIRRENITIRNCFQIWKLRRTYFAPNEFKNLETTFQECIAEHFKTLSKEHEFLEIDPYELISILKHRRQRLSSSKLKFKPVVDWVKYRRPGIEESPEVFTEATNLLFGPKDSNSYGKRYLQFLERIELEKFSCNFLLYTVLKHSLTQKDGYAKEHVAKAICSRLDKDISELTAENFIRVHSLLRSYTYKFHVFTRLKRGLFQLVLSKVESFAKSDEFLEIDRDEMIKILESPDLPQSFEDKKFNFVVKWINHREEREEYLHDLFHTVKIPCLSKESLSTMISNRFIRNDVDLLHEVIRALNSCRNDELTLSNSRQDVATRKYLFPPYSATQHQFRKSLGKLKCDVCKKCTNSLERLPGSCSCVKRSDIDLSSDTESTSSDATTMQSLSGRSSPDLAGNLHG